MMGCRSKRRNGSESKARERRSKLGQDWDPKKGRNKGFGRGESESCLSINDQAGEMRERAAGRERASWRGERDGGVMKRERRGLRCWAGLEAFRFGNRDRRAS